MTYQGMKKSKKEKLRAQVKSRFYYLFWGAATVSVVVGQVFVATGFRRMAESLDGVLDAPIQMDIGIPKMRHLDPWEDHPSVIR